MMQFGPKNDKISKKKKIKKKGLHRNPNGFSGQNLVISKKKNGLRQNSNVFHALIFYSVSLQ